VQSQLGEALVIIWRSFPLEQVNAAEGPEWKLWEQPADYVSRGRDAFHAAIAARNQGTASFEAFHYGLLHAKHVDGKNHGRRSVLLAVAEAAGLDMERFERDLADASLLERIGEDYEHARNTFGVFGTPTLVFPCGAAAYLKMRPAPPAEEALVVWDSVTSIICDRPYIAEIKRPIPPTDND
jgi:predicted DsbA family dithiol-disulfide isomerase